MNLILAAVGLYRMITGPANMLVYLVYLVYIVLHLYARYRFQKMDEQCDTCARISTRAWQGATIAMFVCCEIVVLMVINIFDHAFCNIIVVIYTYLILMCIVLLLVMVACNIEQEPLSVPVRHDAPDTCRYLHPEM